MYTHKLTKTNEMYRCLRSVVHCTIPWPNWGTVQCTTDLEHLYRIYSILTHDKHQWLLLQFIVVLMMEAKGV